MTVTPEGKNLDRPHIQEPVNKRNNEPWYDGAVVRGYDRVGDLRRARAAHTLASEVFGG